MRSSSKKNKYNNDVFRSLAQITQFGINMIVPILLCTFLGIFLDRKLGTSFIVIILFFLGAAAGARNIYIAARQITGTNTASKKDAATNNTAKDTLHNNSAADQAADTTDTEQTDNTYIQ